MRLLLTSGGARAANHETPGPSPAALGRFVLGAVTAIGGLALATSGVALAAGLTHRGIVAPPAHSQALPATNAVASAALNVEYQRLNEVLSSDYPRTFGGVSLAGSGAKITVYMTQIPHGLTDLVDAIAPSGSVAFARSAHSLATLLTIHRDLGRDWLNLQSQGIDIVGFDPDVSSSTEQIQVIGPTLPQVEELVALFGSHTVSIDSVGSAPIPASYTLRVESETHGGMPANALQFVIAIEAGMLALVAIVVVRARRHRPPTAAAAA